MMSIRVKYIMSLNTSLYFCNNRNSSKVDEWPYVGICAYFSV